jgi:hypothetical protein
VNWDNLVDKVVLGPELLKDMENQMLKIKKNLKETQDRQKSYVYKNMKTREFEVGDHVLLKVNPKKRSLKLGNCTKLAAKFCGLFEILDIIWLVALPASMNVHNLFQVFLLKRYVHEIMLLIGI